MPFMNCSRCGLVVRLQASYMTLERCPRCLARDCVPVAMYISDVPRARLAGSRAPGAGPARRERQRRA